MTDKTIKRMMSTILMGVAMWVGSSVPSADAAKPGGGGGPRVSETLVEANAGEVDLAISPTNANNLVFFSQNQEPYAYFKTKSGGWQVSIAPPGYVGDPQVEFDANGVAY